MGLILIIVVVVLIFGGGGGYYTHSRYGNPLYTTGGILMPIVFVLILLWLFGAIGGHGGFYR
jgi:hypothetical protein